MCKRTYSRRKRAYENYHNIPGHLVSDGCNTYGVETGRNYSILGGTTQVPCDYCKAKGL